MGTLIITGIIMELITHTTIRTIIMDTDIVLLITEEEEMLVTVRAEQHYVQAEAL